MWSVNLQSRSHQGIESRAFAAFGSGYRSVVAVRIVVHVVGIIRTTEAVVVVPAAGEAVPSAAKALVAEVCDATRAEATNVACANTPNASSAKAADVASAEAANVASAKTTTAVPTTTAAATGFGTSSQQAAGEHCARQNHHHSSSHDILLWDGRAFRHRVWSDAGMSEQGNRQRHDTLRTASSNCAAVKGFCKNVVLTGIGSTVLPDYEAAETITPRIRPATMESLAISFGEA
jgi:hypothetical protein